MKRSKPFLFVIIVLALLCSTQPVHADMAPPPAPALGGLRPLQYQSTEVQMLYERVELTIQPKPQTDENTDEFTNNEQVDVTAWFVMRNTGTKDEEMKDAFPLNSLNPPCEGGDHRDGSFGIQTFFTNDDSFKVTINGSPIDVEVKEIEGIECVNWAIFDVRFPAQQDVLVKVDYSAETWGFGYDMLLQYVLETGAGWKGPIKQAYIVARFPYIVTDENINTELTTPGFQYLYNEIFWSYRDIEPTPNDNINIRFFEPKKWESVLALRDVVHKAPTNTNAWISLLTHYGQSTNIDKIHQAFEKALQANPNSAEIYAMYANQISQECCTPEKGRWELLPTERENFYRRVSPLVNKALALDHHNKTALDLVNMYQFYVKDMTFTPPPTIPPTATSLVSATPAATETATRTQLPSQTPIVVEVTVVQTRIVSATPQNTTTPLPTSTPLTTTLPTARNNNPQLGWFTWLVLLLAGAAIGFFVGRNTTKK